MEVDDPPEDIVGNTQDAVLQDLVLVNNQTGERFDASNFTVYTADGDEATMLYVVDDEEPLAEELPAEEVTTTSTTTNTLTTTNTIISGDYEQLDTQPAGTSAGNDDIVPPTPQWARKQPKVKSSVKCNRPKASRKTISMEEALSQVLDEEPIESPTKVHVFHFFSFFHFCSFSILILHFSYCCSSALNRFPIRQPL
jgi:hypothetical protein